MTAARRIVAVILGPGDTAGALLVVASLAVGLTSLLALGWAGSPFRLHAPGAALWAAVAGAFGVVALLRAPRASDRRLVAGVAVAVAALALVEALVVVLSFVPCGGRCL